MTIQDGIDTFSGSKGVSSNRLNKTVFWHGIGDPPIAGVNEIPTDGKYQDDDTGEIYKNTGTTILPTWTKIPSSGVPSGVIQMFAGIDANIPSGYFRCNGAAISRRTYDDLFAVVGTTWGNR